MERHHRAEDGGSKATKALTSAANSEEGERETHRRDDTEGGLEKDIRGKQIPIPIRSRKASFASVLHLVRTSSDPSQDTEHPFTHQAI